MFEKISYFFVYYQKEIKRILKFLVFPAIALLSMNAYAEGGVDLLAGTGDDLKKTIQGSGKFYLYAAEFVIGTVTFIKTRNPLVFAGVIVLALGFNIIFKIAGI